MHIVVGPVLTRKGGYAFDCWTSEQGLSLGYTYGRVEDAYYARNVEIRSRKRERSDKTTACSTVDDFVTVCDLTAEVEKTMVIMECRFPPTMRGSDQWSLREGAIGDAAG
jgi:hypothetical protein